MAATPRQTHTYAELEVSDAAFDELRDKLRALGDPSYLYRYTDVKTPDGEPTVIHFGGEVGLVRQKPKA